MCKHVVLSQKLKTWSCVTVFLHCFPSPLFQATRTKCADDSMPRIGCLWQLVIHLQCMHSTNVFKCKREPKDFKGFVRFAHKFYFTPGGVSMCLKVWKNSKWIDDQPWKADISLTTYPSAFWSPEAHSAGYCLPHPPTSIIQFIF